MFVKTAQRHRFALVEVGEILAFGERGELALHLRARCAGLIDQIDDLDRRIADLEASWAELVALKAQADRLPKDDTLYCSVIEHHVEPTNPTNMINNIRRERSRP